jgi:hypothetical protein
MIYIYYHVKLITAIGVCSEVWIFHVGLGQEFNHETKYNEVSDC